ncbi:MAG: DUF501 domain-containing protein [Actinomycetes bacterium]
MSTASDDLESGAPPPRPVTEADRLAVGRQLGRDPRGMVAVAHRCSCGEPDVVMTAPRLPDNTPFPTLYYVTCPRITGAVSTLEAEGRMRAMQSRLEADPELRSRYEEAHRRYLAERDHIEVVPEIAGTSAGGMPDRVKCLHVLVGQAMAAGRGVNPFGDEAIDELEERGLVQGPTCAERSATA